MARKIVNNSDAGTATKFGGDDLDYINRLLTGTDQSGTDPLTINTTTTFGETKAVIPNILRTTDFIIYSSGGTYKALKTSTGTIVSSNSDFKTVIQFVINSISPAGTPTTIILGSGDFVLHSQIDIPVTAVGNIHISGIGMGITNIKIGSGFNALGTIDAIRVGLDTPNVVAGSVGTLTVNANAGVRTVTMSTTDAAKFVVGDYLLLSATNVFSTQVSGGAKKGEIHRATAVNTGTGVITFEAPIFDSYTTANTATVFKPSFINNIWFSDLTIVKDAALTSTTVNFLMFWFAINAQANNVQIINSVAGYYSGIVFTSCLNSSALNCLLEQTPANTLNFQYGITVQGCCQNITIDHCRAFGRWRHPFELANGYVSSNRGYSGPARNIVLSSCVTQGSDTAGVDAHADGEDVSIVNSNVIGGSSVTEGVAIQVRCKRPRIVSCLAQGAILPGIHIWEDSSDAVVENCTSRYNGTVGLLIDPALTRVRVIAGTFANNTQEGIFIDDGATYCSVIGAVVMSNGGDGIKAIHASNTDIETCTTTGNTGVGIYMSAPTTSPTGIIIQGNDCTGNTGGAILLDANATAGSKLFNNSGFVTENAGTATITSAATTVVVTHGLSYTPALQDIIIVPTNNPTNTLRPAWISSPTSTQFTINVNTPPGTSTATFIWHIRRA